MDGNTFWNVMYLLALLAVIYQLHRVSTAILAAVEAVRLSLNHRLTEWKEETRATAIDSALAAHQAGKAEGAEAERRRGERNREGEDQWK